MNRVSLQDITFENVEQLANAIINGTLLFERFSPQEQRGFRQGGRKHVIASLLSGRSNSASPGYQERDDFKRERQLGAAQEDRINKDGNIIVIDADIRLNDKNNEMLRRLGATRDVNPEAGLAPTAQTD